MSENHASLSDDPKDWTYEQVLLAIHQNTLVLYNALGETHVQRIDRQCHESDARMRQTMNLAPHSEPTVQVNENQQQQHQDPVPADASLPERKEVHVLGEVFLNQISSNKNDDKLSGDCTTSKQKKAVVVIEHETDNNASCLSVTFPIVKVTIVDGPNKSTIGCVYTLHPRPGAPCILGRSSKKEIKETGVSIPKDSEISTNHGHFEVSVVVDGGDNNNNTNNIPSPPNDDNGAAPNGKPAPIVVVSFVDHHSTNGSYLDGDLDTKLMPHTPYQLHDGSILTCGKTVMQISIDSMLAI